MSNERKYATVIGVDTQGQLRCWQRDCGDDVVRSALANPDYKQVWVVAADSHMLYRVSPRPPVPAPDFTLVRWAGWRDLEEERDKIMAAKRYPEWWR